MLLFARQIIGGFMNKKEEKDVYRSSDPFFIVECNQCGRRYWSTRRINRVCAKCGAENPYTHIPEHIRNE